MQRGLFLMARKQVGTIGTMKSWDDVDNALKQIGEIECRQSLINAEISKKINDAKAQYEPTLQELNDQKTKLEQQMKTFAESNRVDFGKAKEKKLTFGSVNFRSSTKLNIKDQAKTLEILKTKRKLKAYIKVKEEIDAAGLKKLDAATLAEIGATLEPTETFGYKVNKAGA